MFDLVIRGATIVDGIGHDPLRAEIVRQVLQRDAAHLFVGADIHEVEALLEVEIRIELPGVRQPRHGKQVCSHPARAF